MARETELTKPARLRGHSVMLENRERAVFSGVTDVDSFNEDEIIIATEAGVISLAGQDLHIARLNLDDGQLIVEGYIVAMDYLGDGQTAKRAGLFSRLFK